MQSKSHSSKTRKRASSSSLVKNYRLKRAILVERKAGSRTPFPTWKMDLRSPSRTTKNISRDKGKEARMSSRRLAATMWEINESKSPRNFHAQDWKRLDKSGELFEAELEHNSPISKNNKDGSKLPGHHRRRSSNLSQKLQLTDYLEEEEMDSVINGSFEVKTTATIKTRLKDINGSLAGSKEMIKALFRLWNQEDENKSSRLTLVSALRVEIDRARHEVEQLINEESFHIEKDTKNLLKRFAAEKVVWKRREQDRIIDAISSVSRELEIEKKLRRQSERLSKRLGKELADTKAELSKAVKKLECEKRAREILEQTYDELVCGIGKENDEVEELKRKEEVEMEEKNEALERLRSDLEVYLGGKQGFDSGNGDHDFGHLFGKIQSGSCQNEKRSEREEEEDSDDTELNSIELSMDSLSKSYTWSFVKDDESVKASVDEVFKGRRSLSEKIQWENICLQRKTSNCLQGECDNKKNSKGRLAEICDEDERFDHKPRRDQFDGNESRPKKDSQKLKEVENVQEEEDNLSSYKTGWQTTQSIHLLKQCESLRLATRLSHQHHDRIPKRLVNSARLYRNHRPWESKNRTVQYKRKTRERGRRKFTESSRSIVEDGRGLDDGGTDGGGGGVGAHFNFGEHRSVDFAD
ncbi:hypothetical protein V2J09_006917 [Rumex salicifolius]